MEQKYFKIAIPEGKMVDQKRFEKDGTVEFIDSNPKLPQSWEDLGVCHGSWISPSSAIISIESRYASVKNRNIIPNGLGKPMLALMQLLQLVEAYNGEPTEMWYTRSLGTMYSIQYNTYDKALMILESYFCGSIVFKSKKLAKEFLEAPKIRELLEIAKPLL